MCLKLALLFQIFHKTYQFPSLILVHLPWPIYYSNLVKATNFGRVLNGTILTNIWVLF